MGKTYVCDKKFTCPKKKYLLCAGKKGITLDDWEIKMTDRIYCRFTGGNQRLIDEDGFECLMRSKIYSTEGFVREIMSGGDIDGRRTD